MGYSYIKGPPFFLNRGPAWSKSGPDWNILLNLIVLERQDDAVSNRRRIDIFRISELRQHFFIERIINSLYDNRFAGPL